MVVWYTPIENSPFLHLTLLVITINYPKPFRFHHLQTVSFYTDVHLMTLISLTPEFMASIKKDSLRDSWEKSIPGTFNY